MEKDSIMGRLKLHTNQTMSLAHLQRISARPVVF